MAALRILALHGRGTSANIWRAQSASFRSFLPTEWAFDFIDGEQDCIPADGIDMVYPAPYLCYYSLPTEENLEAAHALIREVIDEEGPFDAVMGFSEGAALAASMILHHQHEHPFSPPLFRFAMFFNAILPFVRLQQLESGASELSSDSSTSESAWTQASAVGTIEHKINIPTAHFIGSVDPLRMLSLRLLDLCDGTQAICFEHEGAHEIPRARKQSESIARAMVRTFEKAQFIVA